MINLAIVDDNEMLRQALHGALDSGCGIEIVGVLDLAAESISHVETLETDLVLMGVNWPAMSRVDICRRLIQKSPSTRVLMLASEVRDEEVLASIMAGASGYIAMNVPRAELIRAIHIVAGGGFYFESGTVDRVIARLQDMKSVADWSVLDELTEREVLILNMIAQGFGNDQIGESLGISDKTVRNNITRIRMKLDLHSRAELAAYAARREIIHELHLRSGG